MTSVRDTCHWMLNSTMVKMVVQFWHLSRRKSDELETIHRCFIHRQIDDLEAIHKWNLYIDHVLRHQKSYDLETIHRRSIYIGHVFNHWEWDDGASEDKHIVSVFKYIYNYGSAMDFVLVTMEKIYFFSDAYLLAFLLFLQLIGFLLVMSVGAYWVF